MRQRAYGIPTRSRSVATMRSILRVLLVLSALTGMALLARRLLAERAPRRELNGSGAILGSLDTWPVVPRNPSTSGTPLN
jgi:hypothetical protein